MFYFRVTSLYIVNNYTIQLQRYLLKCKFTKKYRKNFFYLFLMHKTAETKKNIYTFAN